VRARVARPKSHSLNERAIDGSMGHVNVNKDGSTGFLFRGSISERSFCRPTSKVGAVCVNAHVWFCAKGAISAGRPYRDRNPRTVMEALSLQ